MDVVGCRAVASGCAVMIFAAAAAVSSIAVGETNESNTKTVCSAVHSELEATLTE